MAEPMYRFIADDLDGRIKSGELAPGEQLKSEVELREEYGQADSKAPGIPSATLSSCLSLAGSSRRVPGRARSS